MRIESNIEDLALKFEQYAEVNGRDINQLAEHKAKSLAIALYQATPVADPDVIAATVKSLGWRVRRKFSGHKKKGETAAHALERMQVSIIRARVQHRKYVASGFLPAVQKLGGQVNEGKPISNPRGYIDFNISGDVKYVEIGNSTPGVVKMEEIHGFVEKAIKSEIEDMDTYIREHQDDAMETLK